MSAPTLQRYEAALLAIPRPGGGCHRALLGVANHGVRAGLDDARIIADITSAIPAGGARPVPESEVRDAVRRARADVAPPCPVGTTAAIPPARPARPPARDGDRLREVIIAAGGGEIDPDGADFWESSPLRIDWPPEADAAEFLSSMFLPHEHVFVGHRKAAGKHYCRTAEEWCREFSERPPSEEFALVCPNPLAGQPGPTRDGRPSYRALTCVAAWRFGVLEFDREDMPRPRQLAFWRGLALPSIAAVVDSGGKSLHVWIRLNATDGNHWAEVVKPLFARLAALGLDAAGATGGQLYRLPGVPRPDQGAMQRLLWLCPEGGRLP